ncbi:MAG: hypothetical protein WC934_08395 [Acidithiobacillus sp.]|jgi:hypothetical protein|uniref:hypothetical protein n=1 Tax=Acidithiobacillus sp. TaxID=1872118 RepID=UPI00355E6304
MILNQVPLDKKLVTDPSVVKHLSYLNLDKNNVEFKYDYSASFPRSKMYQIINGKGKGNHIVVISNLSMMTPNNSKIIPGFYKVNDKYILKNNLFEGEVEDSGRIVLSINKLDCIWNPKLFLDQTEIKALGNPILFETDPINNNYHENYLEWDYGICKRYVRIIEGRLLERWIFAENPGNDIRIVHNCESELKPRLGIFGIDDNIEFISKDFFNIHEYPISISATETLDIALDGHFLHTISHGTFPQLCTSTQSAYNPEINAINIYLSLHQSTTVQNEWNWFCRGFLNFDISSLIENSNIISASLELVKIASSIAYGTRHGASLGIFSFNPVNPLSIGKADFNKVKFGTVSFCSLLHDLYWWQQPNNVYYSIMLNNDGLTFIQSKLGSANCCFGGRTNWDVDESGVWESGNESKFACYSSEQGTENKPKLIVEYEPASTGYQHKVAGITQGKVGGIIPGKFGFK